MISDKSDLMAKIQGLLENLRGFVWKKKIKWRVKVN